MRTQNFAFIDIEATGINVLRHEILEIGCVLTTPELKVIEEFELLVKPERIEDADPVSLKVTRYNKEEWKEAITLKNAMQILSEKTKDCIMVGQNVSFDVTFLEAAFTQTGVSNHMHYHKLDTLSIAWAKFHKNEDVNHFSLHELCQRFGIENKRPHTSLSDARATYELYKKLLTL